MKLRAACVLVVGTASGMSLAQGIDTLWTTNCSLCHGKLGQGGGVAAKSLLGDAMLDQNLDRRFFDAIKGGNPNQGMPTFGKTMSDEQIWGLVVYVRELQTQDYRNRIGSPKPEAGVYTSRHASFHVETVADTGMVVPWAMDFMPDGAVLITERAGGLRILRDGKLSEPIPGTPTVRNKGQGGLMEVALHPNFKDNGWIYLAYTDEIQSEDRSLGMTKIVRGKLKDGAWTQQETVFQAKPEHYLPTDIHFGCRIAFDPDDPTTLFFSIGERGMAPMAQDKSRPNGKIHRIRDDGSIPSSNPFVPDSTAYGSIWSYGHRNPQGLVFDLDRQLWDTEHGPRGGDELNRIEQGDNYGWPIVSFGINYNGSPLKTPWSAKAPDGADIRMPAYRWLPSIGACGLDVVRGPAFPAWKGDLLAGGLSGSNVDRIRVKDGAMVEREELLHGLGRVRDISVAPDGTIYIALNDPDKIIRLTPVDTR